MLGIVFGQVYSSASDQLYTHMRRRLRSSVGLVSSLDSSTVQSCEVLVRIYHKMLSLDQYIDEHRTSLYLRKEFDSIVFDLYTKSSSFLFSSSNCSKMLGIVIGQVYCSGQ